MQKFLLLIFLLLYHSLFVSAQLNSIPQNLSNVKAADISEQQVAQIAGQMRQNNFSTSQVYQILIDRGMASNEAAELRNRIEAISSQNLTVKPDAPETSPSSGRVSGVTGNNTIEVANPLRIFGLEIFNNGVLNFQPDVKIATPTNYVIGPDDEISLTIFGYQEARYNLVVSPEGDINIPLVGVVYVSGLTIEQASAKIRSKLAANGYSNIRTGLTKVNVGISRIRSIRVTVLGEVRKPGSYTLSSLSTAFNALYLSGGPTTVGSMRLIEIIRNGKIVDRLDIYDFLVKGDQSGNIRLQDQDIIRVPTYKVRVSLEGEVKRTGLFEVIPGENLEKVLDFAGGFTDSAYTASIKAYRASDTAKQIFDISKEQFKVYKPSRAEAFVVRRIIDRFTNRVVIRGAVFLPGEYELTDGMTLLDLFRKTQGLREDAYRQRGIIVRFNRDLTTQLVQFSPAAVLTGRQENILLQRNDEITISSIFDIRETFTVTVNGEVRRPGNFTYTPNITLKDLILIAGGFTDAAAPQRIEIARRVRKDSFNISDLEVANVIEVNSATDLNTFGADVRLEPWDVVTIRRNPAYRNQISVGVAGEIVYPGPYVIESRDERVSDLVRRAGGFTGQAYLEGAYITRINRSAVVQDLGTGKIEKIQRQADDTSGAILEDVTAGTVRIAVDLARIIKNPHSDEDLKLQDGDLLTVTKQIFEVKVSGEVMFPTLVVYKEGEDLMYYVDKAGGFTDDARKKKTYVLYGNGNAAKIDRVLFVKNLPKIKPGAEILVPKIPDRKKQKLSTGEIVAITSGVASLVGVLIALLNFIK